MAKHKYFGKGTSGRLSSTDIAAMSKAPKSSGESWWDNEETFAAKKGAEQKRMAGVESIPRPDHTESRAR